MMIAHMERKWEGGPAHPPAPADGPDLWGEAILALYLQLDSQLSVAT